MVMNCSVRLFMVREIFTELISGFQKRIVSFEIVKYGPFKMKKAYQIIIWPWFLFSAKPLE